MEKPTFKQKVDGCCKFLYNGETGELLGRGGRSWAEIGIFYIIYYICLSGFFAATIAVFYQTVDEHFPKLQDDASLLRGNPGLGFKPMPDIETTLIHVSEKTKKENADSIKEVLKMYKVDATKAAKLADCAAVTDMRDGDEAKKACKVNTAIFTEKCGEDFGYGNSTPCVLLKLNRIFGWKPEPYAEKPKGLEIADGVAYQEDRIWIDCQGENAADKDNLGSVKYYPEQGFKLAYYPFRNQENYQSPLVMIKFENPAKHIGMMVRCTAYAKNIEVDPTEKQGSVGFELLVD